MTSRLIRYVLNNLSTFSRTRNIHTAACNAQPIRQEPVSKPEGVKRCTMIPGDGVGPDLVQSVKDVFQAANVPVEFDEFFLSEINRSMSAPFEEVVESIRMNGIAVKGLIQSPHTQNVNELQTLNMKLRQALDLFANVVHIRSLDGIRSKHHNLDFIIIREQTEGEYSALEHESVKGVIECLKIVTKEKSERIAKFAFDYATKHGRNKVTAVHKANIMKLGDGLFLRCCEEISELYPKIKFESMIVDNCCMQLVSNPHQFDVLVMPNLYGNIIDNLAAGLIGGAGVVPGASYSSDSVMYEPGARHTFTEAVGRNIANPTAMLLCAANMLNHINLQFYSNQISSSIMRVMKAGKIRTKDIGGHATTTDLTKAVIDNLHVI